jgi:hypothetical protein
LTNVSSDKDFRYDVFLSYRWVEPDESWVRYELYPALQRAGLRVCLDVEDFAPGRDVMLEMDRAGTQSRHILCVLSPEYFEGNRMTWFESQAARSSDPAGSASTLVPLMLRDTQTPNWMKNVIRVNWVDESGHAREWRKLLNALNAPNANAAAPGPVGAAAQSHVQLLGKGNYLAVSNESPFTEKLRRLLLASRKELGIEWDHYGQKAQTFKGYKNALFHFLDNAHPAAKWLFTVHLEDGWGRLNRHEERDLLERLDRTGKRIIFFESGLSFLKHDPSCRKKNIFVIRTNYDTAVQELISEEVVKFVRKSPCAHFVTLLGPRCSVADERRRIYNEFLAGLQYSHGFSEMNASPGADERIWRYTNLDLSSKVLRITSLTLDSWYRAEARAAVLKYCSPFDTQEGSFYTCFLCGNDDIALGARDAVLKLRGQQATKERRVAFIGFDGIDEFVNLVNAGLEAATMRVDLEGMCQRAVQIVTGSGEPPLCEIVVPAHGMGPAHRGGI